MPSINDHADDPAAANEARADRAWHAIRAYMGDDEEFYLHDLICDLGHWLSLNPLEDFGEHEGLEEACQAGIESYREELDEELDED